MNQPYICVCVCVCVYIYIPSLWDLFLIVVKYVYCAIHHFDNFKCTSGILHIHNVAQTITALQNISITSKGNPVPISGQSPLIFSSTPALHSVSLDLPVLAWSFLNKKTN